MRDFHELFPDRFLNVTNGVTPRRWIALSNPGLAALVTEAIGDGWLSDAEHRLAGLEALRRRRRVPGAVARGQAAQQGAPGRRCCGERTGVVVDPDSLFDVQVKRLHEYKRQHLNVLHIVALYDAIKRDPAREVIPRTFIFGGKAAPGYAAAKLIIKLINAIAEVVNDDADVAGRLKVVFFPDFNVTNGQLIYPAADVSEQISTAGKEASGTGNMKFAMNGALTVGTLDGANVEIREAVGAENFFLFGLTAAEVRATRAQRLPPARPLRGRPAAARSPRPDRRRRLLARRRPPVPAAGRPTCSTTTNTWCSPTSRPMLRARRRSPRRCADKARWTRMSILNTARVGRFSSDRAIREYCEQIWRREGHRTGGAGAAKGRP